MTVSTPLLFIISSLVWGTTWIAITFQLGDVLPAASVSYRFAIATLFMIVITKFKRHKIAVPIGMQGWFMLLGLFYTLNYVAVYRAEIEISSGIVAVAGSCIMFFNIILSRLLFRHTITRRMAIGASMGLLGVCGLFYQELLSFNEGYLTGAAYAISAALAASMANMVAVKSSRLGFSVMTTNVWWMLWCTIFTGMFALYQDGPIVPPINVSYVASLFYLALFGSVIAFTSFLSLMERVGPSKASYIAVITPVLALIISTLFEGLQWQISTYFGVVLIIAGQLIIFVRPKGKARSIS